MIMFVSLSIKVNAEITDKSMTQGLINGAVDENTKDIPNTPKKPLQILTSEEKLVKTLENKRWWGGFRAFVISPKSIDAVPLYNQCDYPDVPYGNYGTIESHGCGIVSLSMIATYLTDTVYMPETLAERFGDYNTETGSYWSLFEKGAKTLGLDFQKRTTDTKEVLNALENGQVVVSLQSEGLFTTGGHYIVLTGINKEKRITVNDPYGKNYTKNETMIKGFENGFTKEQIFENGTQFWIYGKKETKKDKLFFDVNILNYKFFINSSLKNDN